MPLFDRLKRKPAPAPAPEVVANPTPPSTAKKQMPKPRDPVHAADPGVQDRVDQLRKRRELVAFDLERAESAHRPDNPWRTRMALLDESIATIERDLADLDALRPLPALSLPPVPVEEIAAVGGREAEVAFRIDGEAFRFAEEPDWDERGGPLVRGDLRRRAGDAARLVPADVPADRREALAAHLVGSVAVLATDLRDRAVDDAPLPGQVTLADLARPCPVCGNWRDWLGHCDTCAGRAWRRQSFLADASRLAAERDAEEEDRHRWAERLVVARRRLADLDADLGRLLDPSR